MELVSRKEMPIIPSDMDIDNTVFVVNGEEVRQPKNPTGKPYTVLLLTGKKGQWIGDYYLSEWSMDASPDVIEAYGSNTASWVDKLILLKRSKNPRKCVVLPYE